MAYAKNNPMFQLICAFQAARKDGADPVYTRLVEETHATNPWLGWVFRSPEMSNKALQTNEVFEIVVRSPRGEFSKVVGAWRPMFYLDILDGDRRDVGRVLRFLHEDIRVQGSSRSIADPESTDSRRDWSEATSDFTFIRLPKGRKPTQDAFDWVKDSSRFLVPNFLSKRVVEVMATPLKDGQRVTIRRLFSA
jgi:hypothetical protein